MPRVYSGDQHKKYVDLLLKDEEFVEICERLVEEGFSADEIQDAYIIIDATCAGEVE